MRKKIAGLAIASCLAVGAGPFAGAAHANGDSDPTDPVVCFVAAQAIITEALSDFRAGHLTAAQLRVVLVGTSTFLLDCLTPSST